MQKVAESQKLGFRLIGMQAKELTLPSMSIQVTGQKAKRCPLKGHQHSPQDVRRPGVTASKRTTLACSSREGNSNKGSRAKAPARKAAFALQGGMGLQAAG